MALSPLRLWRAAASAGYSPKADRQPEWLSSHAEPPARMQPHPSPTKPPRHPTSVAATDEPRGIIRPAVQARALSISIGEKGISGDDASTPIYTPKDDCVPDSTDKVNLWLTPADSDGTSRRRGPAPAAGPFASDLFARSQRVARNSGAAAVASDSGSTAHSVYPASSTSHPPADSENFEWCPIRPSNLCARAPF